MQIAKAIEQLGYRPNEVKVYLALLGLGEGTISEISRNTKISPSSVQIIMNKLHKDGLMNFYIRKRYKYWTAESPEKFMQIIQEKEEVFSSSIKNFVVPHPKKQDKPSVKVFSGVSEIKLIHDHLIQSKHAISAIIPWKAWVALLGSEYIDDFIALRVRHFLNMRLLVPKSVGSIQLKSKDAQELRCTKFLPENITIEDTLFIFGTTVAIISFNEQQPTGVIIDDPATARMVKIFFEDLWERSCE